MVAEDDARKRKWEEDSPPAEAGQPDDGMINVPFQNASLKVEQGLMKAQQVRCITATHPYARGKLIGHDGTK